MAWAKLGEKKKLVGVYDVSFKIVKRFIFREGNLFYSFIHVIQMCILTANVLHLLNAIAIQSIILENRPCKSDISSVKIWFVSGWSVKKNNINDSNENEHPRIEAYLFIN